MFEKQERINETNDLWNYYIINNLSYGAKMIAKTVKFSFEKNLIADGKTIDEIYIILMESKSKHNYLLYVTQ